jgi:hypothetical protein
MDDAAKSALEARAAEVAKGPNEVWPQKAPIDGEIYGFRDPAWDCPMVAMNMATWHQFMHNAATMKQYSDALKEENSKLKAAQAEKRIVVPGFGRA